MLDLTLKTGFWVTHGHRTDRRTPDWLKFMNSLQVRVIVPNLVTSMQAFPLIFIILTAALDVCYCMSAETWRRETMLWSAFHFHSVLLIFVNLWPISTLCVADMVHAVANLVCGRYRLWPIWFWRCGRYGLWPLSSFPVMWYLLKLYIVLKTRLDRFCGTHEH